MDSRRPEGRRHAALPGAWNISCSSSVALRPRTEFPGGSGSSVRTLTHFSVWGRRPPSSIAKLRGLRGGTPSCRASGDDGGRATRRGGTRALPISIRVGQITILLDKGVSTQFIVDYSVVDNCHTSPCYCCDLESVCRSLRWSNTPNPLHPQRGQGAEYEGCAVRPSRSSNSWW